MNRFRKSLDVTNLIVIYKQRNFHGFVLTLALLLHKWISWNLTDFNHQNSSDYPTSLYENFSVHRSYLHQINWTWATIITWLLCFSPASIDSSLVSTDSSPVSTDSSLLAFLSLEPSPLQSKCTLVNKICIVLYFDNILFHLIWKKYIFN